MFRWRTLLPLLLLVASCGGADSTDTTGDTVTSTAPTTMVVSTTTAISTTAAPTTTVATTTTAATTTTVATTTTGAIVYLVVDGVPPVLGGAGDPHGSGCAPPAGDLLPDGIWFGEVVAFAGFSDPTSPGMISLDLACYFTGAAADAARVADGLPAESDYDEYVRNKNPKIYLIPLSPTAEVWSIPLTPPWFPDLIPADAWPRSDGYFVCPGVPEDFCPVWIYINGGVITGMMEMFFE